MHYKKLLPTIVLLLACGLPLLAFAEHSTDSGNYTVHHNAFTTDTLVPAVAKQYGVTRSKNRGILNVVILKKTMGTSTQPLTAVTADIKASAANLTGQLRELELREVREGNAIYYISEFRIADQETLDFTLGITPTGDSEGFTVKFRQQFFTN